MTTPTTEATRRPRPGSDRLVALAVINLAAAAWIAVALIHGPAPDHGVLGGPTADSLTLGGEGGHCGGGHGQAGPGLGQSHANRPAVGPVADLLLVLGGWTVMVLAMMVPPALPLLQTLRRITVRRRWAYGSLALGVLAFVAVWAAVGVVLIGGDVVLHAVAERQPWADRAPHLITGAVLVGAGLYQFTPLKRACLRACRSPRSFALAHWRGRRPAAVELVTIAGAYGVSCVGCCWALMAVGLAVGAAALPAMVALAVVMAAERLLPWGRRLVTPVGIALIVLGALTALGLLPA